MYFISILTKNDAPGAHNKYEPEIEAGVSKISVPSTWSMSQSFGYNVYEGPDAAVRITMSEKYVTIIMLCLSRF